MSSFFLFVFGFQFPIGIDSERFIRALEVPDVIQHMKELKERFAGRKVWFIMKALLRQRQWKCLFSIFNDFLVVLTGDVRC